jgi:hypothetical protein
MTERCFEIPRGQLEIAGFYQLLDAEYPLRRLLGKPMAFQSLREAVSVKVTRADRLPGCLRQGLCQFTIGVRLT